MFGSINEEIAISIREKFGKFLSENKEKVVTFNFDVVIENNIYIANKKRAPPFFLEEVKVPKSCLLIDYKIFSKNAITSNEDFSKPPYSGEYITRNAKYFGGNGTIFVLMGEELRWIEINFSDALSWKDIRG